MRKIVSVLIALMFLSSQLLAQTRIISGKVTDSSGAPVLGASIAIKGASTGTSSNANGTFKISAQPNDVLVISSLNFATQEIKVGNQERGANQIVAFENSCKFR